MPPQCKYATLEMHCLTIIRMNKGMYDDRNSTNGANPMKLFSLVYPFFLDIASLNCLLDD